MLVTDERPDEQVVVEGERRAEVLPGRVEATRVVELRGLNPVDAALLGLASGREAGVVGGPAVVPVVTAAAGRRERQDE